VEKEPALGGLLRSVHSTLEGADVEAHLQALVEKVQDHPGIDVYLNAMPASIAGHIGNFKSVIKVSGSEAGAEGVSDEVAISHGVVVIATGGEERPT